MCLVRTSVEMRCGVEAGVIPVVLGGTVPPLRTDMTRQGVELHDEGVME